MPSEELKPETLEKLTAVAAGMVPAESRPDPDFPVAEYVGGQAGTGKTHLMRERAEKFRGIVLAASTGIAAVNLGEGVTTINSLFGFFDTASLHDTWTQGYLASRLMKFWRAGTRQIVLDEVSMIAAEQLTIFTAAVAELNKRLEKDGLGRMGLTLTGDMCQLPPVKAPFPFEADCWEMYEQNMTLLKKFWRQTDPQFLEALQAARRGDGARAAEYFQPYFQLTQDPDYPNVTLLSKNDECDRFNLQRLSKLPGERIEWVSRRWGKPKGEWKLIPEKLSLKAGALVMILANMREYDEDTGEQGPMLYANGDLAELLDDDGRVRLRRNGKEEVVFPVTRKNLQVPEPGRAKELKAQGKTLVLVCGNLGCRKCRDGEVCKDGKYEVVGAVTYMPLRLAYATTPWKSQGLTLEQVQVDFRDRFWESPGALYVGLSRVKTPEGLRLVGRPEQFVQRCKADPKVRRWL